MTRNEAMAAVKAKVIAAVHKAGFLTREKWDGRALEVAKDGLVVGSFDFASIYTVVTPNPANIFGTVTFSPSIGYGRRSRHAGRYRVTADGDINAATLRARLVTEYGKVVAARETNRLDRARAAYDSTIEHELLGGPEPEDGPDTRLPIGVSSVRIFDCKVDINLRNLEPPMAAAVLAVLKGTA